MSNDLFDSSHERDWDRGFPEPPEPQHAPDGCRYCGILPGQESPRRPYQELRAENEQLRAAIHWASGVHPDRLVEQYEAALEGPDQ